MALFALWADLSTPDTICMRFALGVAFSGWTATFLSTALAIYLQGGGISLEHHIQIVDSLAIFFFTVAMILGGSVTLPPCAALQGSLYLLHIAESIARHPAASAAMGFLVAAVGFSWLVTMTYTILLIPVAMLGLLVLGAAVALVGLHGGQFLENEPLDSSS
jgi:hypothetical protein